MKNRKNRKRNKKKMAFIGFLATSICYYIAALISIFGKVGSNWAMNLCLGSTFLCLSTIYLNHDEDKKDEEGKNDKEEKNQEDKELAND